MSIQTYIIIIVWDPIGYEALCFMMGIQNQTSYQLQGIQSKEKNGQTNDYSEKSVVIKRRMN